MSSARLIKSRIKSAKNISQITKAMEMVSASKMRRAQDQALAGRPYAEKLTSMLQTIALRTDTSAHLLLQSNTSSKILIVLISSDRGLSGSLNTNLMKATEEFVKNKDVGFIAVGKKAREYVVKLGYNLIAEFTNLPERIHFEEALPMAELMMKAFLTGEYGEVHLVHMRFISTLSQKVQIDQILPLSYRTIEQPAQLIEAQSEYVFEPSTQDILEFLLPYYIEVSLYQTLLDAKASEHSARMVAMKNASDNAKDVVRGLQLMYNKSRQASITTELIDMTTATLSIAA